MSNMTIIANHLKCDCEKISGSKCSDNLRPPSKERTEYWHCKTDKYDILCSQCTKQEYEYDENHNPIGQLRVCLKDGTVLEQRFWPNNKSSTS